MIFEAALSIVRGEFEMAWWRKDTQEEDEVFIEAAHIVSEGLSDADGVRSCELKTGKNLRDQVSVEEMQKIAEEAKLRGFGWLRN